MDEFSQSLWGASMYTVLDANSGYWQLPVRENYREITAFSSHAELYEFTRIHFGLLNSPAMFQRALDIILAQLKWPTFLVYLDDIINSSKSIEDHMGHADLVYKP